MSKHIEYLLYKICNEDQKIELTDTEVEMLMSSKIQTTLR